MGVSKESISKFLIGNRFHVKLHILSPYSVIGLSSFSNELRFVLVSLAHSTMIVHTSKQAVAPKLKFQAPAPSI